MALAQVRQELAAEREAARAHARAARLAGRTPAQVAEEARWLGLDPNPNPSPSPNPEP